MLAVKALMHFHLINCKMLFALEAFRIRKQNFSGPRCQYLKKSHCAIAKISRLKPETSSHSCQWCKYTQKPFKVNIPPAIFNASSISLKQQFKMTAKLLTGFMTHASVRSVNICQAPVMCWGDWNSSARWVSHVILIFPSCFWSCCEACDFFWPMGSEQMCYMPLST